MIAVLLITVLFVLLSVYFFFRAEKLQRTIILQKREIEKSQKENQILAKAMNLMAGNTEEFAKKRLHVLLNKPQEQETLDELTLIKPFINSYSLIFKECLMKSGKLHTITRKCYPNKSDDIYLYKDFCDKIIKKDSKLQKLWNRNNFIGFVSLAESLLVKYEGQSQASDVTKSTPTKKLG